MVMSVVKGTKICNVKPMNTMLHGEVCKVEGSDKYVVSVWYGNTTIYLLLNDHGSTNSYSGSCTLPVRELETGESITIKFS